MTLIQWIALLLERSRLARWILYLLTAVFFLYFVSFRLDWVRQAVVAGVLLLAMLIAYIRFPRARLLVIFISFTLSSRYFYWRTTETLNLDRPINAVMSILLLAAELYGFVILVLGYFETLEPVNRKPAPLPPDPRDWPTVDVFIPTYNEPLDVLRPTVVAALSMDYPRDKFKVYVLDDGRRPEVREMAEELGAHYITRPTNIHAKAGNINNALKQTDGEIIAIFDADHVPVRSFLQFTVGFFLQDERVAIVQTPHHFYNPDPFQRNLYLEEVLPGEQEYFYHLVQPGKDLWGAAFFTGSAGLLRRKALEEIGGIAWETVTEDAHTSLKLHARGWKSAYLSIPQVAGLATERYAFHTSQRIRWTRGMVQVFRLDNPLFKKGLTLAQRLAYFNSMIHFFFGIARLVFILAPLSYLLFHIYPIDAWVIEVIVYGFPHIIGAVLASSMTARNIRHSFWPEVYEVAMSFYAAWVALVTLIFPHKGRFVVTTKGEVLDRYIFDTEAARPLIVLFLLAVLGVIFMPLRWVWAPEEVDAVLINGFWNLFNLIVLYVALLVAYERPQRRRAHRIKMDIDCDLMVGTASYACRTVDISETGARIAFDIPVQLEPEVFLVLHGRQGLDVGVEGRVVWVATYNGHTEAGVQFENLDLETRSDIIRLIFSPADQWVYTTYEKDNPLKSLGTMVTMPFRVLRHTRQAR